MLFLFFFRILKSGYSEVKVPNMIKLTFSTTISVYRRCSVLIAQYGLLSFCHENHSSKRVTSSDCVILSTAPSPVINSMIVFCSSHTHP